MIAPANMHTEDILLPNSDTILQILEGDKIPRMSFILVHDLAEHSGTLRDFGRTVAEQCENIGSACNVYAVRLSDLSLRRVFWPINLCCYYRSIWLAMV